jgi:hypothetical protein
MRVPGKLELTVKINQPPQSVTTVNQTSKRFDVDCDGMVVSITLRQKPYKLIEDAIANYPQWVAVISGKLSQKRPNAIELLEPSIQVFERKPKAPPAEPAVAADTAEPIPPKKSEESPKPPNAVASEPPKEERKQEFPFLTPDEMKQAFAIGDALGETERIPRNTIVRIARVLGMQNALAFLEQAKIIFADGGVTFQDASGQTRSRTLGGIFFWLARNSATEQQRYAIFQNYKQARAKPSTEPQNAPESPMPADRA